MAKYLIREADISDVDGISDLRKRIKEYKDLESENYDLFWKGLIWDNPSLIRNALVAVDNNGKILAHYAVAPFRFLKDGDSMLGGFVCQLMVDENYRQEFIFPKMIIKMLREYKKRGIDFTYSLSSRAEVVKAHEAFGFRHIGDLPVYAKPYNLSRIAGHMIKNPAARTLLKPFLAAAELLLPIKKKQPEGTLKLKEIPRFQHDVDSFIANIQHHFPYSMLRNADILNWRTVDFPARHYRILTAESGRVIEGYVIVRLMQMKQFNVLAVVDIMYSPEQADTGTALLNAVQAIAVETKSDMTSCLISPKDPVFPVLKKCGYIKTPESISLFVHEPKGAASGLSEESLEKWHIMWLDHDSM